MDVIVKASLYAELLEAIKVPKGKVLDTTVVQYLSHTGTVIIFDQCVTDYRLLVEGILRDSPKQFFLKGLPLHYLTYTRSMGVWTTEVGVAYTLCAVGKYLGLIESTSKEDPFLCRIILSNFDYFS